LADEQEMPLNYPPVDNSKGWPLEGDSMPFLGISCPKGGIGWFILAMFSILFRFGSDMHVCG
jgi:hypothetical protein